MKKIYVIIISSAFLVVLAFLTRTENQYISDKILPIVLKTAIGSLLEGKSSSSWEILHHEIDTSNNDSHYYVATIDGDKVEIVIYLSMMGWEVHTLRNNGEN